MNLFIMQFSPVSFLNPGIFLSTMLSTPSAHVRHEVSHVNSACCLQSNSQHSTLLKTHFGTLNLCTWSSNCILLTNTQQELILLFGVWYSDSLRAGQSWDRILVGARFSAPV